MSLKRYIIIAIIAAILFGASTPVGKILLSNIPPFQLAGLLYLGAALGLLPFLIWKKSEIKICKIDKVNLHRLVGAICFGGIIAPVLLLFGLRMVSATSVAMWLNLELVATAVLGYLFFKDYLGVKGWIGVIGTIVASVLLSWQDGYIGAWALMLVAGASVCWGLDNHLTGLIDGITPTQSTFWKGLVAGITNLLISVMFESYCMQVSIVLFALLVGVFAYGFSITLYILAAQNLGATRSQMIFSSAPLFGVVLALVLLGETISLLQVSAASILIIALFTLFKDQHSHMHAHEVMYHNHEHNHNDHHNHSVDEINSHVHWHQHKALLHDHIHLPDLHHRHEH
jgi:drug/metabolite transporter (DMT)-like permease